MRRPNRILALALIFADNAGTTFSQSDADICAEWSTGQKYLMGGGVEKNPEKAQLSWKHTGFSIDNSVNVYPSDERGLERLARYLIRSPVSLQRLHDVPQTKQVFYQTNKGHDQEDSEIIDSMEFVARVLMHVPDLNKPYILYYGIYSNRSQHKPRKDPASAEATRKEDPPRVSNSKLHRRWANLIRRVYQAEPLICPKCESKMWVIAFITQPRVINKILEHLKNRATQKRAPPTPKLPQAPLPLSP